jgi:hypothetical protein
MSEAIAYSNVNVTTDGSYGNDEMNVLYGNYATGD